MSLTAQFYVLWGRRFASEFIKGSFLKVFISKALGQLVTHGKTVRVAKSV